MLNIRHNYHKTKETKFNKVVGYTLSQRTVERKDYIEQYEICSLDKYRIVYFYNLQNEN